MSAGKCATCRKDLAGHDRELFETNKYHPFAPYPANRCATCGHDEPNWRHHEFGHPCHAFVSSPAVCLCQKDKFDFACPVHSGQAPAAGSEPTPPAGPGSATPTESPRRWLRTYYGRENVEVIEAGAYDELASALAEALAQQNSDLTDLHQKIHAEDAEKLAEAEREAEDWYNKFANTDAALAEMQKELRTSIWFEQERAAEIRRLDEKLKEMQRQRDEAIAAVKQHQTVIFGQQKDQRDLQRRLDAKDALLKRISEWDTMDSAGDGPYWRAEIARQRGEK